MGTSPYGDDGKIPSSPLNSSKKIAPANGMCTYVRVILEEGASESLPGLHAQISLNGSTAAGVLKNTSW